MFIPKRGIGFVRKARPKNSAGEVLAPPTHLKWGAGAERRRRPSPPDRTPPVLGLPAPLLLPRREWSLVSVPPTTQQPPRPDTTPPATRRRALVGLKFSHPPRGSRCGDGKVDEGPRGTAPGSHSTRMGCASRRAEWGRAPSGPLPRAYLVLRGTLA